MARTTATGIFMRRHELSFANFILRFGPEEVLINRAEEIVIPAFLERDEIRTYGETNYFFHDVRLANLGDVRGVPLVAIRGRFIKDTVLHRQQTFDPTTGIVDDPAAMASAPSAYFILILNNHRLLYFAETSDAPSLQAFRATIELRLKAQWNEQIRAEKDNLNVTRGGNERLTLKDMARRIPPPILSVIRVAGEDEIANTLEMFKIIKQVRFKLLEPNHEIDPAKALAAVEESLRPAEPSRLEVIASQPKGLAKEETKKIVVEASEGHNTEIIIDGKDHDGNPLKADNDEFAISVPIDNPPENDKQLTKILVATYKAMSDAGKIKKIITPTNIVDTLRGILSKNA